VAADATVCPHCERKTEAVRGTCPNCGQAKDGEASWFVPGLAVLLIGLVLVESMALVVFGVAVLLAPAVIWFLFEGSDGSWW
jgi:Flp pilus assembly protein TadB